MQRVSTRLVPSGDFSRRLDEILDAAIDVTGADMGNIQLLEGGALKIAVQRGFDAPFLEFFGSVHGAQAASGTALQRGERVVVHDVADSPIFAGTPALEVMRAAGARAVQSTPLISRAGRRLGMLSTHYRRPYRPDARELRLLDMLARQAADMVERTQGDAALRESEQRFRGMADGAPVLIWMSGPDKLATWFNQQWLAFVGRTMDQEVGEGWVENLHEDDRDRRVSTYIASFDARQPFAMEHRLRRHDGEYRWVLDTGRPFHEPGGQFAGFIGSCIDITEVKRSAAALAAEVQTTRAFFDSAAEGIVIVNQTGRILSINARGEQMFGYAPGELIGQPVERLLPERFRDAHHGHRGAYFAAPRTRSMGLRVDLFGHRKDGTDFPIEISLSPIDTPDGPLAMALVTDVTERRNLERAARQHEKLAALATLSAGIAHELNNPIGIISTRIELMLQDAESQPMSVELTEDLQVLHRNIQRVIRIAKGLLSFARQSQEQQRLVAMNAVVEETLLLVGKQLSQDGIRLSADLAPNLGTIWGDPDALQQVVTNLLLNARDAMPRGGDLRVETRPDPHRDGWVLLEIADTGDGMPPERLERIWEPFYTTKTTGTGLGLSVSHRIIQEHHGAVDVISEVGRGTIFTLRFPSHFARSTTA